MLQDQKIGHYMHVPPRAIFFAQIFGSFIGVPINYGTMRWILDTKKEFLLGTKIDPTHQWTGQSLSTNLITGVQYVLIVSIFHPIFPSLIYLTSMRTGTTPTLCRSALAPSLVRIPAWRSRAFRYLRTLARISPRELQLMEYYNFLLRYVNILGQCIHRLSLWYYRRICRDVLGLSPPL
jgi:hypothetical protein